MKPHFPNVNGKFMAKASLAVKGSIPHPAMLYPKIRENRRVELKEKKKMKVSRCLDINF